MDTSKTIRSLLGGDPDEAFRERFWRYVARDQPGGCWLWTGHRASGEYGRFIVRDGGGRTRQRERLMMLAHRVSYELHAGPIEHGLCVCHRCDVRLCVNPDHLFLGTYAENNRDARDKGRAAIGIRNGAAKMDPPMVRLIRQLAADGVSQREIGRRVGLSQGQVSFIVRRKTWAHVR